MTIAPLAPSLPPRSEAERRGGWPAAGWGALAAAQRLMRCCFPHPQPLPATREERVGGGERRGRASGTLAAWRAAHLLRLDVGGLGDLRPAAGLAAHPGVELGRRVAAGKDPEVARAGGELRRLDHRLHVRRQLLLH